MNKSALIAQLFHHSPVNTDRLQAYLMRLPTYRAAGRKVGADAQAIDLLSYTDFFEFALKRYLAGRARTLHGVFWEIRRFHHLNEREAPHLIAYSLQAVKATILRHEWYELMPRYEQARRRIESQFRINSDALLKEVKIDVDQYLSTV